MTMPDPKEAARNAVRPDDQQNVGADELPAKTSFRVADQQPLEASLVNSDAAHRQQLPFAPQRSKKQERTMADEEIVRVVGDIFGITLAVDPDVPPDREARFYEPRWRARRNDHRTSRHPFKRSS
jgi:hypothetical protein